MKSFRYDLFQGPVVLLGEWPDGWKEGYGHEPKYAAPNLKSKEVEKTIVEGRRRIRRNNRKHGVKKVA